MSLVGDYYSLMKPKVMYLVLFTSMVGLLISGIPVMPLKELSFIGSVSLLCIALGSGSAAALNMWYDSDIDILMERTRNRPIPSGKVTRQSVLQLGIALSVIAVTIMSVFVNILAAVILLSSISFYIYIYTVWLKRRTPQNIVIGGAAGAFPPIIGCAAITNSITLDSLILFLIIFLWTPPHFWALALGSHSDYEKANIPMLPCIYGESYTVKQIVFYTFALIASTWMFSIFGSGGIFYTITSNILNAKLISHTFSFYKDPSSAKSLFVFSISYLFSLFTLIAFDSIIWSLCGR